MQSNTLQILKSLQISDPDNEIAQAPASPPGEPPSPPGPPGLDKELEVRRVVMPVVTIDPHAFGVTSTSAILTSL